MRIQINLSDNMVKKVDLLADNYGVSRSALCSTIIGQYVYGVDTAVNALSEAIKTPKKETKK